MYACTGRWSTDEQNSGADNTIESRKTRLGVDCGGTLVWLTDLARKTIETRGEGLLEGLANTPTAMLPLVGPRNERERRMNLKTYIRGKSPEKDIYSTLQ